MATFLLIPLWVDGFFYIYYLIITGISVIFEMPAPRLTAVAIISIIFLFALIMSGLYLLELSHWHPPSDPPPAPQPVQVQSYTRTNPEYGIKNLYAYSGSPPVLDGIMSNNDRWDELEPIQININGRQGQVFIKHDMEYLYVLMRWNGLSVWEDSFSIYLEQDGISPDPNIKTGRIDWYYQANNSDPSALIDGHYDSGYVRDERQDGSLRVGYNNSNSEWVMEWKIPLSSGDKDDINIIKYPYRIRFAIINEKYGEAGILPPYANRKDPDSWANIKMLDTRSQ